MNLRLPNSALVFFIDETGHEEFSDVRYPVFGMGGCAVMAPEIEGVIRGPWMRVRAVVAGAPDRALHASSLPAPVPTAHIDAIASFFREQPFARFAVTCSLKTSVPPSLTTCRMVLASLKSRIAEITRWTPATSVHVVFEATERLRSQIEEGFGDLSLEENGIPIPCDSYFMPKSASEPGLEVADFVMHAAGRQARRQVRAIDGVEPDFAAVFHSVDRRMVSYIHITEASFGSTPGAPLSSP